MSTFQFRKTEKAVHCRSCNKTCQQGGILFDFHKNRERSVGICSEECLMDLLESNEFMTTEEWESMKKGLHSNEKYEKKVAKHASEHQKHFKQQPSTLNPLYKKTNPNSTQPNIDAKNINEQGFEDVHLFANGDGNPSLPLKPVVSSTTSTPLQTGPTSTTGRVTITVPPTSPATTTTQKGTLPPGAGQISTPKGPATPGLGQSSAPTDVKISASQRRREELENQIREAEEQQRQVEERRRQLLEKRQQLLLEDEARETIRDAPRDSLQDPRLLERLTQLFTEDEIVDIYAPIYKRLSVQERINLQQTLKSSASKLRLTESIRFEIRQDLRSWLDTPKNINEIKLQLQESEIFAIVIELLESGQLNTEQNSEDMKAIETLFGPKSGLIQSFIKRRTIVNTVIPQFNQNPETIASLDRESLQWLRSKLTAAQIVEKLPTLSNIGVIGERNNRRKNITTVLTSEESKLYTEKIDREDAARLEATFRQDPNSIQEFDRRDFTLLLTRLSAEQIIGLLPTYTDVQLDRLRNERRQKILSFLNEQQRRLYQQKITADEQRLKQGPEQIDKPLTDVQKQSLRTEVLNTRPDFTKLPVIERQQLREILSPKELVSLVPVESNIEFDGKIGNEQVLTRDERKLWEKRQTLLFPTPLISFILQNRNQKDQIRESLSTLEIVALLVSEEDSVMRTELLKSFLSTEEFNLLQSRNTALKSLVDKNILLLGKEALEGIRRVLLPWEIIRYIPLEATARDVENDLNEEEKRWFEKRSNLIFDRKLVEKLSKPRSGWEIRAIFTEQQLVNLLPLEPSAEEKKIINKKLDKTTIDAYQARVLKEKTLELEQEQQQSDRDEEEDLYEKDKEQFDSNKREREISRGIQNADKFIDILEQGYVRLAKELIKIIDFNTIFPRDKDASSGSSEQPLVPDDLRSLGQPEIFAPTDSVEQKYLEIFDNPTQFRNKIDNLIEIIAVVVTGTFWGDENIPDQNRRLGKLLQKELTGVMQSLFVVIEQYAQRLGVRPTWKQFTNIFFKKSSQSPSIGGASSGANTSAKFKPEFGAAAIEELLKSVVQEGTTTRSLAPTTATPTRPGGVGQPGQIVNQNQPLRTFIQLLVSMYEKINQFIILVDQVDPGSEESGQFEDALLFFTFELLKYMFESRETKGRKSSETPDTDNILSVAKDLGQVFALQVLDDVIKKDLNDQIAVVRQDLNLKPEEKIQEETLKEAEVEARDITEQRLVETIAAFNGILPV